MSECCDCIRTGTVVGISGNSVTVDVDGSINVYDVPRGNIVPQIGQEVIVDTRERVVVTSPKIYYKKPDVDDDAINSTIPSGEPPYFPFAVARGKLYSDGSGNGETNIYFYVPFVDADSRIVETAILRVKAGYEYFDHEAKYNDFTHRGLFRRKSDGQWVAVVTDYLNNSAENRIAALDYPIWGSYANVYPYFHYIDFFNGDTLPLDFLDSGLNCPSNSDEETIYIPPLGTGAISGKLSTLSSGRYDDIYFVSVSGWGTNSNDDAVLISEIAIDLNGEVATILQTRTEVFASRRICDSSSISDKYIYRYPTLQYDYGSMLPQGSIISSGRFSNQYTVPEVVNENAALAVDQCDCTYSTKPISFFNFRTLNWRPVTLITDPANHAMKYGISCCGLSYVESGTGKLLHDHDAGYTYIGTIGGRYDVWYKGGAPAYVFAGNGKIVQVYVGSNIRARLGIQYEYNHFQQIGSYETELFWAGDDYTTAPVVFDADYIDTFPDNVVTVVDDDASIVYRHIQKSSLYVDASTSLVFKWPGYGGANVVFPLISYTKDGTDYHTFTEIPKPYELYEPSLYDANMFAVYGEHGYVPGFIEQVVELRGHKFTIYVSNTVHNGSLTSFGNKIAVGYKLYGDMLY